MESFYDQIPEGYPREVRRFVPGYDLLIETVSRLTSDQKPSRVLDIGCGDGTLGQLILSNNPNVHYTGIDLSEEMIESANKRLSSFDQERYSLIQGSAVSGFQDKQYDAIISTLALHNLSGEDKQEVICLAYDSLRKGGMFIWGDLIHSRSLALQELLVGYRHIAAFAKGATWKFVKEDWYKERQIDDKLTVAKSIDLLREIGFVSLNINAQNYQGTWAIFSGRK